MSLRFFTSTEHHWPHESPKAAPEKTTAELRAENERLQRDYALFEEMAPPDVPRSEFVKQCFDAFEEMASLNVSADLRATIKRLQVDLDDASEALQLHQISGDYEAGQLHAEKAMEAKIREQRAEIEQLQAENAGLKRRLAKTHGDSKYIAEVEAAEAGKQ